jgi:hypothetical protein
MTERCPASPTAGQSLSGEREDRRFNENLSAKGFNLAVDADEEPRASPGPLGR